MKKKNYSQKTIKNITIVALFGLISAIGASSTLFFMKSSDSTANQPGGIVDNNGGNEEPEDLVKSKLFENITAADLTINDLHVSIANMTKVGLNLDFTFTGGANYLNFMKDFTGNTGDGQELPSTADLTTKFGGNINIQLKEDKYAEDGATISSTTQMLNEDMRIYAPGNDKIYLEWNETGYTVSGQFITNSLDVVKLFLNDEQKEALNDIIDQILAIDILNLLPMIGSIGGSLAGSQYLAPADSTDGSKYCYDIEVPGSLLGENFESDLKITLFCDESGQLTNMKLVDFKVPQLEDGASDDMVINLSTSSIRMNGISGSNDSINNFDSYKEGISSFVNDQTTIEDYYSNNLDTAPNILYTVAKLMDAKEYDFGFEVSFDEYEYTASTATARGTIASEPTYSHDFVGSLKANVNDGFENGIYSISLDKNMANANQIDVVYQPAINSTSIDENNVASTTLVQKGGVYVSVNKDVANPIKAYINTDDINDMMTPFASLMDDQSFDFSTMFDNANDILNDTVIGDIINGEFYKYKEILDKITLETSTIDGEEYHTINIGIKAKGLNLNIPFEFEDVVVNLKMNYKGSKDSTLIKDLVIENIPIQRKNRLVGPEGSQTEQLYLDTASLKLNINEVMFDLAEDQHILEAIDLENANTYVDFKQPINFFKNIGTAIEQKHFSASYTLKYAQDDFDVNLSGSIKADLSNEFANPEDNIAGRNFGTYELGVQGRVNDVEHHFQLNYQPVSDVDQTLFFQYYSQNPNYKTRLSLKTQSMVNMFDAVSSLIESSGDESSSSDSTNITDEIFGTMSDTLSEMLDFSNGSLWNVLSTELDTNKIIISGGENNSNDVTLVKIDTSLFGGTESKFITIAFSKNETNSTEDYAITALNLEYENIKFSLNFDNYNEFTGLTAEEYSKYKESDSSVDAIVNLLTGDYFNSFSGSGRVTTEETTPRN